MLLRFLAYNYTGYTGSWQEKYDERECTMMKDRVL